MFSNLIPTINANIKRTKKAIVSIGCSFVQGQGAIDEEIYRDYKWNGLHYNAINWQITPDELVTIREKYPEVFRNDDTSVNFTLHENRNSFVTVLCEKYFNGDYAAINLGRCGNGNRASIKELYFYPGINWDELEEIIVIYCPSGAERMDFIDDAVDATLNEHPRWISAWPSETDGGKGTRNKFWSGYRDAVYSDKYEMLEQISHIQELLTWCKWKKAKLIVTPAFMRYYTREKLTGAIKKTIHRNDSRDIIKVEQWNNNDKSVDDIVNMWPWENVFLPDGKPTFVDLAMAQEFPKWEKEDECPGFFSYHGKGTPGGWITPCSHPSVKAHDLFAKLLHKHITEEL